MDPCPDVWWLSGLFGLSSADICSTFAPGSFGVTCDDIGRMTVQAMMRDLRGLYHFGDLTWSLYEIGEYVLERGNYPAHLLMGMLRHDEKNGPPRVGDVSLNYDKLKARLQTK